MRRMASLESRPGTDEERPDAWIRAFHAGERACLESCYKDHLETVTRAVGGVVQGADRETLVHEVFFRLLSEASLRQSFSGGAFASWLRVVARHQAIDYARRRCLEVRFADEAGGGGPADAVFDPSPLEAQLDIRRTLQRFRECDLPAKWRAVFDARFVAHQDQPTAARALGMSRTTLAYQEHRIRRLLRRFVLRGESR
jgi:RNA polymerase sigma-70 factor, ECF subfamily